MIIVQTPLRVSFLGGGTDFPEFYKVEGGAVLSSAIDKYIFVTVKRRFDRKLRIGYTKTEMVDHVDEIQHELVREALRKTGVCEGVEITTMGDIPSAGTGLGSSSTVTVGTLHALYTFLGEIVTAERLAQEACEIEISILKKPIGVQDQYIVAYGGLRFLEFFPDGRVRCEKVELNVAQRRLLNDNLMLFYTGVTRSADRILTEQRRNIEQHWEVLRELKRMAYTARDELKAGNIDFLGELLHQGWELKKRLAEHISNGEIDAIYAAARKAGAIGGKITGAGGGGFLMLYCPYDKQEAVRAALHGLQELPFRLEHDGTKVIFNYRREY
jgi:D-glycero-alpha-D-manno-heptose-7-phosphate kinase